MIFSLIAGWLTKRIWPTGVLIVVVISAASALIDYFRYESVNSSRELIGLGLLPNGLGVVVGGFLIDVVINFFLFMVAWGLRRKFRPHPEIPEDGEEALFSENEVHDAPNH